MGNPEAPVSERRYEELLDNTQVTEAVCEFVNQYNQHNSEKLNIVVFR